MTKNRLKSAFIFIMIFTAIAILSWFVWGSEPHDIGFNNESVYILNNEVKISYAGKTQNVMLPVVIEEKKQTKLTVERVLTDADIKGSSMAFYVRQSLVKVYFDDELYFADKTNRKLPYKLTPGSYWRMFRLPEDAEGKTLKIEIDPIVSRYSGEAPTIYVGNKSALVYMVLRQGMSVVVFLLPFLVLGIVLLITGILAMDKNIRLKLSMLGMFAITTSIWTLLEARLTQTLFNDIDFASVVLFTCYYSITFFAAAYIDTYESFAKNKIMRGIMYLSGISFLVIHLLQMAGVIYYIEAVFVVHILIGCIIGGTFLNFLIQKKRGLAITDKVIYYATILLGLFCAMDVVRYYVSTQFRTVEFSKVGFLIFFFYLGFDGFKQLSASAKMEAQNEIYRKLAFLDTMTNMKNRTAFEQRLNLFRDKVEVEPVIFTIADMNDLKYINDTYGHKAGDEAIMSFAKAVATVFSECSCYRIGGDEFCIISEGLGTEEIEKRILLLEKQLQEAAIGKEYIISGSVGYAILEANDVDACFKKADEKMYKTKAASKKGRK